MEVSYYSEIKIFCSILFSIISISLWYLYGCIDAINIDNYEDGHKSLEKIKKYDCNYNTHLILGCILNSFISVYFMALISYGYIGIPILLLAVIIFKHLGFHDGMNHNKFIFFLADKVYTIEYPIILIFHSIVRLFNRGYGLEIEKEYVEVTEDEIISIVNDGREQGILDKEEAERINNIVELGEKEAMDIMTPRINVVAIDDEMLMDEVIDFVASCNYSRLPVYHKEIDNIVGVLHIRDLFTIFKQVDANRHLYEYKNIIRKAYFVPSTKNIDDIFKEMQGDKMHLAIVIDEYGQLDGVLSLEDIIEEVMGNIADEYDNDEKMFIEIGKDKYLARGLCMLETIEDKLSIKFDSEFETVNGFLTSKLDHIPNKEDENFEIEYMGYKFRIEKINNRVIQLVKIIK